MVVGLYMSKVKVKDNRGGSICSCSKHSEVIFILAFVIGSAPGSGSTYFLYISCNKTKKKGGSIYSESYFLQYHHGIL